ncbi:MAG: putative porin [Bacteroidales bacterium]|nr:putative porin [Bacteroidales bacterium]
MMKTKIYTIISACFALLATSAFAEDDPTDTAKVKEVMMWSYNATHTQRSREIIDTTVDYFYLHEPNGSIADFKVDVAGYASPAFSLQFSPLKNEPFYLGAYESSLIRTENMPDYTAQHPYTTLTYTGGLNGEQSGKVLHTQNVNKYLNVGFCMDFYKTVGEFDNQNIKGQHIAPWISYYGPKFSTVFKYSFNNILRQENGGIVADSLLNYEKLRRMKFTNAKSNVRYQNVDFVQKWNLGAKHREDSSSLDIPVYKIACGYRLNFESAKRTYSDSKPDTAYYTNVLYDSLNTTDSSEYKILSNSLFLEFSKNIGAARIVADFDFGTEYQSLEYFDYNYSIPEYFEHSEYYKGAFDFTFPNELALSHTHLFYVLGPSKGQFSVQTMLSKEFAIGEQSLGVTLSHSYEKSDPHPTFLDYEANNYAWHNNFVPEKLTDCNLQLASSFGNLSLDAHLYSARNYVYFDNNGNVQNISTCSEDLAFTVLLKKKTAYKHFMMTNGLLVQSVSMGEQDYPNFATYNSMEFRCAMLHKLIHLSLGGELLYYPKYNAPVYDAALGAFLPQNNYKYGGFPLVNAYATIKYKPIRLFVKYSGLYALFEQNYAVASYPQSNGTLSFGLTWLFNN